MKRYILGLGLRKLASILGIHDTMLARWENNHAEPPENLEHRLNELIRRSIDKTEPRVTPFNL